MSAAPGPLEREGLIDRPGGQPLAERAYERIRYDIVFLRLEPGEPLDDKRLSAEFGMSLTPVRDALKRLTLERLVVTYPRRGTFVAEITVGDEQWLTEIRQNLEGVAAALAAHRATQQERGHLNQLTAQPRATTATTPPPSTTPSMWPFTKRSTPPRTIRTLSPVSRST